jgi:DNA polymerase III delta prime subunit
MSQTHTIRSETQNGIYMPEFPIAERFFAQAITSGNLAHGYILKGQNMDGLYGLALTIAQILNCQNPPTSTIQKTTQLKDMACQSCTSCRWVLQNSHPSVLTISRLTYLVSDKGGDLSLDDLEKMSKKGSASTQIKAEQVERLLAQLSLSAMHNRVIIFCDVEERGSDYTEKVPPPSEWKALENNFDKTLHIRPLQRNLFNAASANRFLKTLEEPPPKTLFFFLAETEEQILETIVSRCQVVPCQSFNQHSEQSLLESDLSFLNTIIDRCQAHTDIYQVSADLETFCLKERNLSFQQALEGLKTVLRKRVLLNNETAFVEYKKQLKYLETAQQMLDNRVNESAIMMDTVLHLNM